MYPTKQEPHVRGVVVHTCLFISEHFCGTEQFTALAVVLATPAMAATVAGSLFVSAICIAFDTNGNISDVLVLVRGKTIAKALAFAVLPILSVAMAMQLVL